MEQETTETMPFTFSVTIIPPPCLRSNHELKALLESPTTFMVLAESADEACDIAILSIPWRLDPLYFAAEASWVRNAKIQWYVEKLDFTA